VCVCVSVCVTLSVVQVFSAYNNSSPHRTCQRDVVLIDVVPLLAARVERSGGRGGGGTVVCMRVRSARMGRPLRKQGEGA